MSEQEMEAGVEHKELQKDGYTVHYYVSGDEGGQVVVFLHPAFADHRCFYRQVGPFSERYRVVTLDMLGHGLSQVTRPGDAVDATAEHLQEILDVEGRESARVVGVSMGSLMAQYFALKYPQRTRSVTALGGYDINRDSREVAKAQRAEFFRWMFKAVFSMKAFRRYVASVSVDRPEEQDRFYEMAGAFTRRSFLSMQGLGQVVQVRDGVRRDYPLLILCGERDLDLALRAAQRWHEAEPDSEFHVIQGAGHCANMDDGDAFNRIVLDFVARASSGTRP